MAASFFFYDLETSGLNPREARIMQFAGQRTDMDLNPIGEPIDHLIRLSADCLPDPGAILITGITPQQTIAEGETEYDFLQFFQAEIVIPDTIFVGYNNVRFDDEFMRFLLFRNFYDAYTWQWKDHCSRWDLLDAVRMTRALRPSGIHWPTTAEGKPTNRLEQLTKANNLMHEKAHDALSDVYATIAVAKLIKEQQPKLFHYLLDIRQKKQVSELVMSGQAFVYTSGKYPQSQSHTTIAGLICEHPNHDAALVYDLRHDPTPYLSMSPEALVSLWRYNPDKTADRLPIKTLKFNRCPAVAPIGVIDSESAARLEVDLDMISKHRSLLFAQRETFCTTLTAALKVMDQEREQQTDSLNVDSSLYDGFIGKTDAAVSANILAAGSSGLEKLSAQLQDDRLKALFPLYKARNFQTALSSEEQGAWDIHCADTLLGGGADSRVTHYFEKINELAQSTNTTESVQFVLEELRLYGESIVPVDASE